MTPVWFPAATGDKRTAGQVAAAMPGYETGIPGSDRCTPE
ncbi:hypothetical protein C8E05_0166 [Rhodococcus wratislaviensis]|uniref:Uncharacterized protein n=1 Tax=Rhodococcus wratislaviensis TaxID=44752 RepID=A0AB38F626_RHOWR|nr:hypothetical protein C8E05_0166 [Rhodococcus wratislaviensis]SPZ34681.1 Uncharacterised protein [Rhodococcus wratislaviensis]